MSYFLYLLTLPLLLSKVCIKPLGACPSCANEKYDTFLDEAINEKLLSLEVQCKYYKKGCHWKKQLRFQEGHLKEECLFRKMECRYGCEEKIHFCELEAHEKDECIQRPPEAKMETIEKRIVGLANEIVMSRAEQRDYEHQLQKLSASHDKLNDGLTPLKDYLKLELVEQVTTHDLADEIGVVKKKQTDFELKLQVQTNAHDIVDKRLKKMSDTIRRQNYILTVCAVLFVSFVIAQYQLKGNNHTFIQQLQCYVFMK